jgi:hypothetical protein
MAKSHARQMRDLNAASIRGTGDPYEMPVTPRTTPFQDVNLPDEKAGKPVGTLRGRTILGGDDLDLRWEEMADRRQAQIRAKNAAVDLEQRKSVGRAHATLKPTRRTG